MRGGATVGGKAGSKVCEIPWNNFGEVGDGLVRGGAKSGAGVKGLGRRATFSGKLSAEEDTATVKRCGPAGGWGRSMALSGVWRAGVTGGVAAAASGRGGDGSGEAERRAAVAGGVASSGGNGEVAETWRGGGGRDSASARGGGVGRAIVSARPTGGCAVPGSGENSGATGGDTGGRTGAAKLLSAASSPANRPAAACSSGVAASLAAPVSLTVKSCVKRFAIIFGCVGAGHYSKSPFHQGRFVRRGWLQIGVVRAVGRGDGP